MEISATAQNGKAYIRIIGEIAGWKDSAESFKYDLNQLKKDGIKDVVLYINSPGGNCFEANEIVNEINGFGGTVTGEGGALVASAATYIAINCDSFEMPENGMFMVHQARGGCWGTQTEIESYLTLLKGMNTTYFDAYCNKMSMDKKDFEEKWKAGDYWMTAKEAKDNGFVTDIKKPTKIDKATAKMIQACGWKELVAITDTEETNKNQTNTNQTMDAKTIAPLLGMSADASETSIHAAILQMKSKADLYDTLKADVEAKEKADKDNKIKTALDAAVKDKKIAATDRASWEQLFASNFETAQAALDGIQAVEKPKVTAAGSTEGTDKKFEDHTPDALAELEQKDPEAFSRIFNDYMKRNK